MMTAPQFLLVFMGEITDIFSDEDYENRVTDAKQINMLNGIMDTEDISIYLEIGHGRESLNELAIGKGTLGIEVAFDRPYLVCSFALDKVPNEEQIELLYDYYEIQSEQLLESFVWAVRDETGLFICQPDEFGYKIINLREQTHPHCTANAENV